MTTKSTTTEPAILQIRDLNVEEIATEIGASWLHMAFTNRRGDLLVLLDDVADDYTDMFYECYDIAQQETDATSDDLELSQPLQEAIAAEVVEMVALLPRLLIGKLLDEVGGLEGIRQWLPLPVIEELQVVTGNPTAYTEPAVLKLLLAILIDAVATKQMGA